MPTLANPLDTCKQDTPADEPEYLAIHSATAVQTARWDDWAVQAAEMLERHGWIKRRIGSGLHLQHPFMIRGAA